VVVRSKELKQCCFWTKEPQRRDLGGRRNQKRSKRGALWKEKGDKKGVFLEMRQGLCSDDWTTNVHKKPRVKEKKLLRDG